MMVQRNSRRYGLLESGPMLTPLIDIIFLVLIFFMVNNSPSQKDLGIITPHMNNAPITEPVEEVLVLHLRSDLSYVLMLQGESGKPLEEGSSLEELEGDLERLRKEEGKELLKKVKKLRLRADRLLGYGTVIAVCDYLVKWELPLDLDVTGRGDVSS